jgi:hypothetical protein
MVQLIHTADEENLVLLKGTASAMPRTTGAKAKPLCRRPERRPKGEVTDLIAFVFAFLAVSPKKSALSASEWEICFCLLWLQLFFAFLAQKSHVKSQNRLTPSNKRK